MTSLGVHPFEETLRRDGPYGLFSAAANGLIRTVRSAFTMNAKSTKNETPLHLASYFGHLEVVKLLVDEKDAPVNVHDLEGKTPVMYATKNAKPDVVEYLTEHGADLHAKDATGKAALTFAAEIGDYVITKIILDFVEKKNDKAGFLTLLNSVDFNGQSALFFASKHHHTNVVELLLAKGADETIENTTGETAVHKALGFTMASPLWKVMDFARFSRTNTTLCTEYVALQNQIKDYVPRDEFKRMEKMKYKAEDDLKMFMSWGKYAFATAAFLLTYSVWCIVQSIKVLEFGSFMCLCASAVMMPLYDFVLVRTASTAESTSTEPQNLSTTRATHHQSCDEQQRHH